MENKVFTAPVAQPHLHSAIPTSREYPLATWGEGCSTDPFRVPLEREQQDTSVSIPNLDGSILLATTAGDAAVIRGNSHEIDAAHMALEAVEFPTCLRIPHFE